MVDTLATEWYTHTLLSCFCWYSALSKKGEREISLCLLWHGSAFFSEQGLTFLFSILGLRLLVKNGTRCCIKLFFYVHFVVNNHIDGVFWLMPPNYIGAQFIWLYFILFTELKLIICPSVEVIVSVYIGRLKESCHLSFILFTHIFYRVALVTDICQMIWFQNAFSSYIFVANLNISWICFSWLHVIKPLGVLTAHNSQVTWNMQSFYLQARSGRWHRVWPLKNCHAGHRSTGEWTLNLTSVTSVVSS